MTRQSAPTDGRNPFGVDPKIGYYTSKQNSDASGMKYQWGRKDPSTFATSSEKWGTTQYDYGKYSVKIYTIDGVLIYQDDTGGDNKNKQPSGGVIYSSTIATSMMETIKNPITFYGGSALINQVGHTKGLWNYYWTSNSRGIDGTTTWGSSIVIKKNFHNNYLDGYNSQLSKSIYDPCPFGFRAPSNGTWDLFTSNPGWVWYSYIGGIAWSDMWFPSSGNRVIQFNFIGRVITVRSATTFNINCSYNVSLFNSVTDLVNNNMYHSGGSSVRCIELTCLALCYH